MSLMFIVWPAGCRLLLHPTTSVTSQENSSMMDCIIASSDPPRIHIGNSDC